MKRSLNKLPVRKRQELKAITSVILENAPAEMIILFGSHARGTWVEDRYQEDNTTYEYRSDFDILAITEKRHAASSNDLWSKIDRLVDKAVPNLANKTPVSIIAHDIKDFNKHLENADYFFTDIKKEGILLYDSKKFKLAKAKELSPKEIQTKANEDFKYWFTKAKDFFMNFWFSFEKRRYNTAAFLLHQVTENLYHTILLVFTGYKPKLHDIEKLGRRVRGFDKKFSTVFPRKTKEEDRLFKLLKKAYIDARYKKSYKITKKELEYLAERVKKLQFLTRKICKQKIESFVN